MSLTARIGPIAAARPIDEAPPELPQLIDGLQGWISTTKGRFRFGDGTSIPGHGKAVHQARNVQDQTVLFSQATAGLRPTWDATTFDVPCIRSDGTQYLTRDTALPAPGLVIVGCALDGGITGFHALTGARSTETPGGTPNEDAWHLNKTDSVNVMRALTATSSGQMFADTPQILGEKLLVMLEIVGDALQVWQVGATGEQAVVGTRIAADGEQVLLAKYFNDAITAIMQGAIFEFAQYAPAPSRAERRMLVQYFQDLIWPASSPPAAATVDAGQIEQGQSTLVDVVTPSSGTSLMLASIDEQPETGTLSISGNEVVVNVPSGAARGNYGGRFCLRSDVAGTRLVDFGRVNFEVIDGTPPPPPPPPPPSADLPFFGQYYGNTCMGHNAASITATTTDEEGVSFFFHAERSGLVNQIRFHYRTGEGYSGGNGGVYSIYIRAANPVTKRPIPGGQIFSELHGFANGNPGNSQQHLTRSMTSLAPLVTGNSYCVTWQRTNTSGYFSLNICLQHAFHDSSDPADYEEPPGISPTSLGSSPSSVAGWTPVVINGTTLLYPFTVASKDGDLSYRRVGPPMVELGYADGQWTGWGSWGGGSGHRASINGNNQLRDRFRVTRASRTVSGVFIRIARLNNSGGNLVVTLESGPASDTSGNGTQIEQVTVPASTVYDVGGGWVFNWVNNPGGKDLVPFLWVPFNQNRTLTEGQLYNIRFNATGGGSFLVQCSARGDTSFGPSGAGLSWAQWEQQRTVPWTAWEDSRGCMVSSNGGSSWSYFIGRLSPILFKCV